MPKGKAALVEGEINVVQLLVVWKLLYYSEILSHYLLVEVAEDCVLTLYACLPRNC